LDSQTDLTSDAMANFSLCWTSQ